MSPFDWGLNFAISHFPALLQAALIPALIKVFLRYVEYYRPIPPRQAFIVVALDLGTKAWLLVTIMLLCIAAMQGERPAVWHLAQKALLTMPKVLMSCVCLLIVAAAFFLVPWMYLFVLFLVWAPFFCAAEIKAKSFRAEEAEDDAHDLYDEDSPRPPARFRYFADKPVWDFGIRRSILFTANRRNLVVTVELALLMLVALTLPVAVVVAFAGFHHSFNWIVVESILSSSVNSIVLGIAAASFLRLLPREAVEELGIDRPAIPQIPAKRALRLHGKLLPFFLIALLGGLATKATVDYIIAINSKPPNLVTTVDKVELTEHQIIINLSLQDDRNLFRWLSPLSLKLQVSPSSSSADESVKPAAAASAAEVDPERSEIKAEDLLEPQRVMPYRTDGSPLPEYNFVPHKGPLRLSVHFENAKKDPKAKGAYTLYYVPLYGKPEPFVKGTFGE